jgi:hypothetical protein
MFLKKRNRFVQNGSNSLGFRHKSFPDIRIQQISGKLWAGIYSRYVIVCIWYFRLE